MKRSFQILTFVVFSVSVVSVLAKYLLTEREEANVYPKLQSFTCRVSPYSGNLQMLWSDEPADPRVVTIREGGYSISAQLGPLPNLDLSSHTPVANLRTEPAPSLTINGEALPMQLWVSDLADGPMSSRPPSDQEVLAIAEGMQRNAVPCLKNNYTNVDLNTELQ
jgi:hypothetical protein